MKLWNAALVVLCLGILAFTPTIGTTGATPAHLTPSLAPKPSTAPVPAASTYTGACGGGTYTLDVHVGAVAANDGIVVTVMLLDYDLLGSLILVQMTDTAAGSVPVPFVFENTLSISDIGDVSEFVAVAIPPAADMTVVVTLPFLLTGFCATVQLVSHGLATDTMTQFGLTEYSGAPVGPFVTHTTNELAVVTAFSEGSNLANPTSTFLVGLNSSSTYGYFDSNDTFDFPGETDSLLTPIAVAGSQFLTVSQVGDPPDWLVSNVVTFEGAQTVSSPTFQRYGCFNETGVDTGKNPLFSGNGTFFGVTDDINRNNTVVLFVETENVSAHATPAMPDYVFDNDSHPLLTVWNLSSSENLSSSSGEAVNLQTWVYNYMISPGPDALYINYTMSDAAYFADLKVTACYAAFVNTGGLHPADRSTTCVSTLPLVQAYSDASSVNENDLVLSVFANPFLIAGVPFNPSAVPLDALPAGTHAPSLGFIVYTPNEVPVANVSSTATFASPAYWMSTSIIVHSTGYVRPYNDDVLDAYTDGCAFYSPVSGVTGSVPAATIGLGLLALVGLGAATVVALASIKADRRRRNR